MPATLGVQRTGGEKARTLRQVAPIHSSREAMPADSSKDGQAQAFPQGEGWRLGFQGGCTMEVIPTLCDYCAY